MNVNKLIFLYFSLLIFSEECIAQTTGFSTVCNCLSSEFKVIDPVSDLTYTWYVGTDPNSANPVPDGTGTDFKYTFSDTGSYRVSLVGISKTSGGKSYITKQITIAAYGGANTFGVNFTSQDITGNTGQCGEGYEGGNGKTFLFTVQNPIEGAAYTWDFGDGYQGFGNSVCHNFIANHVFEICLYAHSGCDKPIVCRMICTGNCCNTCLENPTRSE